MNRMSCEKEIGELILKQYGQFFKHQHEDLISLFPDKRRDKSFPTLINIHGDVDENIRIYELIESDNNVINKILTSFCSLLVNIVKLKEEALIRHYAFLSLYGEYENAKHGSSQEFLCANMESICKLTSFVQRLQEVCKNVCHQVFAMYSTGLINIGRVRLQYVINHIGDLLTVLVTLDLLILNSRLPEHWESYSKSVKQLSFHSKKYNISQTKLKSLLDLIKDVNGKIMQDKIFENTLNKLSTLRHSLAEKNCATIAVEFNQYLKSTISNLEKTGANVYESRFSHKWIATNALFVFNNFIFANTDKKTFRTLVDINMKAHSVPIYGTAVWYPEQFMQRYLPSLYQSQIKLSQNLMKMRQSYVTNKKISILQDTHNAQLEVSKWVLAIEESFCKCNSQTTAHKMNLGAQLLMKGIDFASQINFLVHSLLNLHMSQGIPITKSVLMAIFQLFETLKSLINAYKRNFLAITGAASLISQHLVFQIISSIIGIKKTLMSDKNYAQQKLDELTALIIAERALRGPITLERRIVAHTALTLIPLLTYPEDSYVKLSSLIENNDKICNLFSQLQFLCNGSLLYWHKDTISLYLEKIFQNKIDNSRLRLIFNVFEDCSKMLVDNDRYFKNSASDIFDNEVLELINRYLLNPIGQQIETNLRLHTHSHLQLDSSNSFTNRIDSIKFLIQFSNIKLNRRFISPRCHIENYVSTIFYNLTTVVLYDWKTYGEMRQLASFKLHLDTIEDNLPTQTLEQGLDVLEIMRNIHIFVSKYMYNLNNQIFVEQSSNNKHLNSINIRHIANSIRTHGTGIMNTTVNFTYQFLRKKFYTFSQFMYDEHIKSRLIKDLKMFRESAHTSESMYNYKNAEKFNKGIRNLGITENGQSYLDLFRILITHIGNAMGYVRMVRSGGRHCCSSATVFLPSLENVLSFCELASRDDLSLMTKESAHMLETTINTLTTNFTQGTEYFQLLVDVFSPVFRNPSNIHLKNFYVIIPPLTINFVENIILCKDRMTKKNKVGAAFTDDGFAMGLAYILKLLDQDSDFNSLHWFQSVWKHINNERKSIEAQREKGPTQLQQALALTEKKLTTLEEEFQLLYFSFSSARIFFQ